jgi:predicted PurR-regulated permease PerM
MKPSTSKDETEPPRDTAPTAKAAADDEPLRPARTPQAARWTLLVLTIIAVVLLTLIIKPFAAALFVAAVLAGALSPWYERLVSRTRGRRQLAAGLTTTAMLLVVVLPVASISVVLAKEVSDGAAYVRNTLRSEGVQGIVNDLPAPLRSLAQKGLRQLPQDQESLQQMTGQQGGRAAAAVGGFLTATWGVVVQMVMMLIAFFFFLVDGPQLVDWLEDVMPLGRGQTRRLLGDFRRVSVTVILSSVATAAIQAVVALVGYLIARVPNPVFFAIITMIVALVPAVGATSVVLAAAAIMYLGGHAYSALFLVLWGVLAVGLIDNVVKPYLIRGGMQLHGAVIFFALVGGLSYFGPVGLIAGPLVVSFFLAVLNMWDRSQAEPA